MDFVRTLDHTVELGVRLGLWIFYLWLDKFTPYIRHIDEEEIWYYKYPSVHSFVPKPYLYLLMLGVPICTYILQFIFRKRDKSTVQDILHQFYGLTLAYCITGVLVGFLKLFVGRPRPNFFLRCFPDGYGTHIENCTGEWEGQMDGRKSFPSAHSSFAFTGMAFVTMHLIRVIDFSKPHFARGVLFSLTLLPLLIATLVAVSRTCDYHHHFSDVIGGAVIGTTIALTIYNCYSKIDDEVEREYLEHLHLK